MSRLLHAGSIMVVLLALSCSSLEARPPREPICGVNLVEALVLVCGDRGFFYNSKRAVDPMLGSLEKRNVVEECCHGSCNLFDLEKYCL